MQKYEIWEKHPRYVLSTADCVGGGFLQKIQSFYMLSYKVFTYLLAWKKVWKNIGTNWSEGFLVYLMLPNCWLTFNLQSILEFWL